MSFSTSASPKSIISCNEIHHRQIRNPRSAINKSDPALEPERSTSIRSGEKWRGGLALQQDQARFSWETSFQESEGKRAEFDPPHFPVTQKRRVCSQRPTLAILLGLWCIRPARPCKPITSHVIGSHCPPARNPSPPKLQSHRHHSVSDASYRSLQLPAIPRLIFCPFWRLLMFMWIQKVFSKNFQSQLWTDGFLNIKNIHLFVISNKNVISIIYYSNP